MSKDILYYLKSTLLAELASDLQKAFGGQSLDYNVDEK